MTEVRARRRRGGKTSGRVIRSGIVLGLIILVVGALLFIHLNQDSKKASNATNMFARGLVAQNAGNYSLASADYSKVIAQSSVAKNAALLTMTYYNLGVIAQQMGQVLQSVRYYRLVLGRRNTIRRYSTSASH